MRRVNGQGSVITAGDGVQLAYRHTYIYTRTTNGATTKSFFPSIVDRLKLRINTAPNFTAIVTGHGNIKAVITRSQQWPISKNKLVLKYYKNFKQFTDSIVLNKE